jgi:ABC-type multidrug transport system ATPase subunit
MKPALVLQRLHLSYGTQRVLNDVSVAVGEGEFFIIIGPNGSGKTSLVKVMSGAVRPRRSAATRAGVWPASWRWFRR